MSSTVKTRKKLIEVALPLEAINRGCIEDKNRKTGHIRNIHKWFAPMPLPSWRAMLFASLVDDPGGSLPKELADKERERLLDIVARLSAFQAYEDSSLLELAQQEIRNSLGDLLPTVVDPFCGGSSTILEAQRLGLPTRASDLNPIPVIITTTLTRAPQLFRNRPAVCPNQANRLFEKRRNLEGFKTDILYYASRVRELAWERLSGHYPLIDDAIPFAYRWAWTVESPNPAAGGHHTPLVSNWWLSRHRNGKAWIQPKSGDNGITFSIQTEGEPPAPTTGRSAAACLYGASLTPIPLPYIREMGRSGRLSLALMAVAARKGSKTLYFSPTDSQKNAALAVPPIELSGIEMPEAALGFRVQQYGINNFRDLFTRRQAFAVNTFAESVRTIRNEIIRDAIAAGMDVDELSLESGGLGAVAYADSISGFLGLCIGKLAQSNNILVRWFIDPRNGSGKATPAFDRHAVPMVWDFVETNPFGGSVGDWMGPVLETAMKALELCSESGTPAEVVQQDARDVAQSISFNSLIATDPPYYANIGYADLSDFFYLWLRVALRDAFPKLFGTMATPKNAELIASPFRHEGSISAANEYFRAGFSDVFGKLARRVDPTFPMLIVYAIKQSEESDEGVSSTGWEVFLGGLADAGLEIVATWPVRTSVDTRMIGIGNNALASAIFVIVRSRSKDAVAVSTREFLTALRSELPQALRYLQKCSIAPVDLAQAAIGPGMAVFTSFEKVVDATGSILSISDALKFINQELDSVLVEQEGDFDSDTRWALTWFDQMGFAEGDYGLAETLSKAKNTSVAGMMDAGILSSGGGKVRLLKPEELNANWEPETDTRKPVWEALHHLVRALNQGGETTAAMLAARLGSRADAARELAYRLYILCERKHRAQEALAYNALVQSWPEIQRLARETESRPVQPQQASMFS